MEWSQAPRVLLEWPDEGKILRNRLDLVLLERYCSAHGSQLALLTRDQKIINQAEEVGIPVFQNRSTAQFQPWRKSFREFIRQDVVHQAQKPREFFGRDQDQVKTSSQMPTWARITLFALAVAAVLAIGATLLPSATVTIPLDSSRREISIPVQAIRDLENISISGNIPSRTIEILVQDQISLPTTGTLLIASEFARGEVTFTNLGENAILIPKNTVLSSSEENSPLFITTQAGATPDGIGSQVVLQIEALEPGILANLPENTVTRINEVLGAELSVTNLTPTSGGADLPVPAPSDADRTKAGEILTTNLLKLALDQVASSLKEGDIILNALPELSEIIETEVDPEQGSAGNTLTVSTSVQYTYYYVSEEDLVNLATEIVAALYPGSLTLPDLESITISHVSDPVNGVDQIARWEMNISWNEFRAVNKQDVIQAVLGKKPANAEINLKNTFELKTLPDIQLIPDWWFRIPALPFRINVVEEGGY